MTELLLALGSVIFINIILSGDNAVVIALASRNLPEDQRKKVVLMGSSLAVALRIMLVVVVTLLMKIPFFQIIGGLALVYIGYKLLVSDDECGDIEGKSCIRSAVKTIIVADLIMSLDNVLAIAAVAKGNWLVLVIGLAISIPVIIFSASILSKLMQRFPIIIYFGTALIAYTAAEMIVSDVNAAHYLEPYALLIKIALTVGVVAIGHWRKISLKVAAKKAA